MYQVEESKKFELLPDGEYEAHVEKAEKVISKNGKEMLAVTFKIREDIVQAGQGRLIFDNIMKDKEKPEYFDIQKIGCIISTQPNHPKQFQSEDQAILYINGIDLRIKITHTDGSDGYDPKNKINGKFGFLPSKVGKYNPRLHVASPAIQESADKIVADNTGSIEVSDSDLPF